MLIKKMKNKKQQKNTNSIHRYQISIVNGVKQKYKILLSHVSTRELQARLFKYYHYRKHAMRRTISTREYTYLWKSLRKPFSQLVVSRNRQVRFQCHEMHTPQSGANIGLA